MLYIYKLQHCWFINEQQTQVFGLLSYHRSENELQKRFSMNMYYCHRCQTDCK